jgi:hypothetical protein
VKYAHLDVGRLPRRDPCLSAQREETLAIRRGTAANGSSA